MSLKDALENNIYSVINRLVARVASLEARVMRMEERHARELAIQREHLVRIKNSEDLPDHHIRSGAAYRDLDPQAAWKLFQRADRDHVLVDVSSQGFEPRGKRPAECLRIPLEQLEARRDELPAGGVPLMIISEEGLRSVLACEFLVRHGHYSCENVSGGWQHWPGHALRAVAGEERSA
jgi:rhodanese-related sulfurtransferase